ncbi:MAG: hypothetical protein ACR2RF_29805 [Geminicoccaceae bacterium]
MNLLEHGCTEEMANAITGQSKEMIRHYGQDFNRHRLAKAAVLKLEYKN